jgi:hypothetical protein
MARECSHTSGNVSINSSWALFHSSDAAASRSFSSVVVSTAPVVGVDSTMNEQSPVSTVLSDHDGFQLSG